MKKVNIVAAILVCLTITRCTDLDLNPTSQSSTSTFFSDDVELEIAVNDLYKTFLFKVDNNFWTDDFWQRGQGTNEISAGSINSETTFVKDYWTDLYKGVARANVILSEMVKSKDNITPSLYSRIEGEARFMRAYYYSILITHFGDVVFYTENPTLGEAYALERTDKNIIKDFIYDELDAASELLPESYGSSELKRATKSAALGIKARTALYMGDFDITRDASKAVMNFNIHTLHPDYEALFHKAAGTHSEIIFSIPNSEELNELYDTSEPDMITRNSGGFGAWIPTWSMVDIYECVDGRTIDESPLYDPHDPFENRDPRMAMSIVEFGTEWLGYIYQPHPDSLTVYSSKQGKRVSNLDNRKVAQFATYTGFVWKKGIEYEAWAVNKRAENDKIILRYADILLMYAEAKIELNEIDQTVLDAINAVRSRAYQVPVTQVADYPAITTTDQTELREVVRRERRVEFVLEGLRYMDLIRWRIAGKALNTRIPGLVNPDNQNRSQWPFTDTVLPEIDDDGIVKHDAILDAGFAQLRATYVFDEDRQYVWPIPANERIQNPNLSQNDGY
jgi:starch-binding outer membrane protein, SusD/RagB family